MTAQVQPPAAATPEPPLATPQQRTRISATAETFEAQMISLMLKPMFDTVSTDGPFGGGQAEGTYRSFLVDAVGKQIARAGGIGLAQPVMREMLRLQGLR
jgi:Rod binding domain-containing protein